MRPSRSTARSTARSVPALAVLLATSSFVTACGAGDPPAPGDADPGLRIEHVYGATEIEEVPERVVTLGWHTADFALALGVVPVGIEADINGPDEDGLHPWTRAALDEMGADHPDTALRTEDWELDYDRILSLDPDVIIATRAYIDQEQYDRLTDIAPTVGPLEAEGNGGSWDEELRTVASVLDADDEAESVIDELEREIATAAEAHQSLAGRTMVWTYPPDDGQLGFLSKPANALDTVGLFGVTEDPSLAEAVDPNEETPANPSISLESLSEVEADVAIVFDYDMSAFDDPLFTRWAPIADGRYFRYDDLVLDSAISSPSPLNLPWLIEESGFLDELEQAVDEQAVVREAPEE